MWYNNTPTRGIYEPVDLSLLPLQGIRDSVDKHYINLTFVECELSHENSCKSEGEIREFLESHFFVVVTSEIFIDFATVLSAEETLQKMPKIDFWDKIGLKDGGKVYRQDLLQHDVELQDDRLNFMGLGSAKDIIYFNTDSNL